MSASGPDGNCSDADASPLNLLLRLGWQLLSASDALSMRGSTREVILKQRLIEVLQTRRFEYKGDRYPLSPSGIDQILRQVQTLSLGEGLLQANERMYRTLTLGITVTEFMPDGKKHQATIALIDWLDAANNRWDVSPSLQVLCAHGTHHRCVGLVAYVNGLPLAAIEVGAGEAARSGLASVNEGIARHLRHQRPDEIEQLFVYAQLLIAVGGGEGRYGTTLTPPKHWARWREEEFTDTQLSAWANRPLPAAGPQSLPPPSRRRRTKPKDQDRLLAALLQPERLLMLVQQFVLFDRRNGKLVARYQQFFGVRALVARIGLRKLDGTREGGVVWHTTGSGKSLTMVFLTKALMLSPCTQACRVLVVTDRLDLQDQLARNFVDSGAFGSASATRREGERAKVSTGRELARRIGQGTGRIVFTLIHKFATATRLGDCYNPSSDLVVLVDEGHRSHSGEMHEHMRRALPRAAYVAFTGTPLLKKDKTTSRFGPIVHAYPMRRAIEDGTVTPLLYEQRVPELAIDEAAVSRWFHRTTAGLSKEQVGELKRRFASLPQVHGAARRIELIAWDIAQHFSENIRKLGLGLKGQVATASKLDAIVYKRCLDASGLVSSAIVMSPPTHREGEPEQHESQLPEVRRWWRDHVGRDAEAYEARVLQGFGSDGEPDLLIVVDRLLTGFDEPRNTVLYIDKPLKSHSLIQAVARVNRLHEAKRYGLLVDYRGILKELDSAMRAYQDLETRTQGGYELADINGLYHQISTEYQRLPSLRAALWALFAPVQDRRDAEALRAALMPQHAVDGDGDGDGQAYDTRQKLRDDFFAALSAFDQCLQTALSSRGFFEDRGFSQARLRGYKEELRFFSGLRSIARQDALKRADCGTYEEQLRRMVDQQVVGLLVRDPPGVYVAHRLGQPQAAEAWSDEKTRSETDMIRTRLKKTIEQDLADDPYARQVFAELLKQAIADAEAMFDHPLNQYALLKTFEEQVKARELDGMPQGLGDDPQVRAYFGIWRLALGEEGFKAMDPDHLVEQARDIDEVVRQAVAEHSLNAQNIEAAIRQALLPRFFGLMGMDKAREAIEQVMQLTRLGLARGKQ